MKALTVRQPLAQAIAEGLKTVEMRSRPIKYRGPLAIHAAAKPDPGLKDEADGMALGCVLCVVNVVGCEPLTLDHYPAAYCVADDGETPQGWAWLLADARRVEPLPATGKLSLWNIDESELQYL